MEPELTIVIPAYNEAEALEAMLPAWLATCQQSGWQLIIVDDCSIDETLHVLRRYSSSPNLVAIRHKINCGYGGALKTGIFYANSEFTITMDADGQHAMSDIPFLLEEITAQDADMVIGCRNFSIRENAFRKIGKLIIRKFARFLYSITIQDLNSGFKLYKTRVVKQLLHLCPDSMAFSDVITIAHVSQKLRVIECPIQINKRLGGKSTISTITALQTMLEIINLMIWFKPLKIFLPVAFFLSILGIGWAIPFLLMERGLSTVSLLLLMTSIFLIMLGLLAHQFSLSRKVILPEEGIQMIREG